MSGSDDIIKFSEAGATMVGDLRHFPLLVYGWHGAATDAMIKQYFQTRAQLFARAEKLGTKIILITDMTHFKPPPATIRKAIGESAKEQDVSDAFHGYFTVVPSALLRGMVTAMQWIGGDQIKPNKNVASMREAVEGALKEFERLQIPAPAISPTYETPAP